MRLLVVGSVAYDSVETAYGKVDRALGGSATFFAMASSLLAPTHVVAVVGEDFRPSDMERLKKRGVDTSGIEIVPGETFRWGGVYSKHFETRATLFTELNVFLDFKPKVPEQHRSAELVCWANIHPARQYDVLDQVQKPKFVALDTMNFWISGEREALLKVLPRIDALFLNDEEAYALSGVGNLLLAAREILQPVAHLQHTAQLRAEQAVFQRQLEVRIQAEVKRAQQHGGFRAGAQPDGENRLGQRMMLKLAQQVQAVRLGGFQVEQN